MKEIAFPLEKITNLEHLITTVQTLEKVSLRLDIIELYYFNASIKIF